MKEHAVEAPWELGHAPRRIERSKRDLIFCLAVIAAAAMIGGFPRLLDYPVMRFMNGFANASPLLDTFVFSIDHFASFSGVVLLAIACALFLSTQEPIERGRVLAGILIAFPAGVLSRVLQSVLPTHPRPFYDPALRFVRSALIPPQDIRPHSFPSDHGAVFGAITFAICLARPRLAWIAVPWFLLIETTRTYVGAHYPTDMIAGAALGAAAVILARSDWAQPVQQRILGWERRWPLAFYAGGFFIAYQIATLFEDLRTMASALKTIF